MAVVAVTIAEDVRDGLDARAAELGISRSLAVEQAVRAWLERELIVDPSPASA